MKTDEIIQRHESVQHFCLQVNTICQSRLYQNHFQLQFTYASQNQMKSTALEALRLKVKLTLQVPQSMLRKGSSFQPKTRQPSEISESSAHSEGVDKNNFDEKYILEDPLGQGAHGMVRVCKTRLKGELFAAKIMRLDEQISFLYRKNFLTMKCLNHENIIKYKALYLDKAKRISYLIMDYIPYPTLKGVRVKDQNQLKKIASQILKALLYMHSKNICHRDLKNENILYNRQQKTLKIIDFGICKKMTLRQEKSQMLTPTGTLAYKAPQMFQGQGYDEKIDIWALGVILYQLVTGKNPFLSEYMGDTIKNIQSLEVQFKDQCWKPFSKICKDLIAHLLKKKRKQRLSTEQAINHLFFTDLNKDLLNISHRPHREKTQKKIAEQYIQTIIYKKEVQKPQKQDLDPMSKGQSFITFVDSEEEDGIIDN